MSPALRETRQCVRRKVRTKTRRAARQRTCRDARRGPNAVDSQANPSADAMLSTLTTLDRGERYSVGSWQIPKIALAGWAVSAVAGHSANSRSGDWVPRTFYLAAARNFPTLAILQTVAYHSGRAA